MAPAIVGPSAQVWVQPNRYYDLNRIHAEVDGTSPSNVLLVNDGKATGVGRPT